MADNKSLEVQQAQRYPDQAGDTRCTRNDGKVWRCKKPRVEGCRFCESHAKCVNRVGGSKATTSKRRHSTSDVPHSEKKSCRSNGDGAVGETNVTCVSRNLRKQSMKFQFADYPRKDVLVTYRGDPVFGGMSTGDEFMPFNRKGKGNSKTKKCDSGKVLKVYNRDMSTNKGEVNGSQKEMKPLSNGARTSAIDLRDEEHMEESFEKQVICGRRSNEVKCNSSEKEEKWNGKSRTCHQCQRNDKDHVVLCTNCDSKRYCTSCIKTWYPQLAEADVCIKCPFCLGNCNCKACLRTSRPKREVVVRSDAEKTNCFKYILAEIFPVLKQIEEEQNEELRVERFILGAEDVKVEIASVNMDERIYCDNCSTSIVDYFRSCDGGTPPCDCTYDLCLACCRELRAGQQPGGDQAESVQQHCITSLMKEDLELEREENNPDLTLNSPDASGEDDDETQDEDSEETGVDLSMIMELPVLLQKSRKDEVWCTPVSGHAPKSSETKLEKPKFEVDCPNDFDAVKLECDCSNYEVREAGEEPRTSSSPAAEETGEKPLNDAGELSTETIVLPPWTHRENWDIPCPPKIRGGCGCHTLRLKSLFEHNFFSQLIKDVEEQLKDYKQSSEKDRLCRGCSGKDWSCSSCVSEQITTCPPDSHEKHIYCPTLEETQREGISHFQKHWRYGQPVIVRNLMKGGSGLSWEPLILWRALRETARSKFKDDNKSVLAVDCSDWSEVDVNIHEFFVGYDQGLFNKQGWPKMYKLKDWPPSAHFEERLPRHGCEFLALLPFRDYTDSDTGIFNLGSKLPESVKPELGPKAYIAYGLREELSLGDSVTKLHCNMSDAVNVLTHSKEIKISKDHRIEILEKREEYRKETEYQSRECLARTVSEAKADGEASQPLVGDHSDAMVETNGGERDAVFMKSNDDATSAYGVSSANSATYGGALWDIFRRDDVPKLQEYLMKHVSEFRHYGDLPVASVAHPIHDRSFFLDEAHKKKLKDEYGVEAWTFEQHDQEAVFIPAGCPHQVRNLKSCIKVAMDFVSPENVLECVRLTDEFRLLPMDHRSREDKLEVKKMILYAAREAVAFLQGKPLESGQARVTKRILNKRKKNLRHF